MSPNIINVHLNFFQTFINENKNVVRQCAFGVLDIFRARTRPNGNRVR